MYAKYEKYWNYLIDCKNDYTVIFCDVSVIGKLGAEESSVKILRAPNGRNKQHVRSSTTVCDVPLRLRTHQSWMLIPTSLWDHHHLVYLSAKHWEINYKEEKKRKKNYRKESGEVDYNQDEKSWCGSWLSLNKVFCNVIRVISNCDIIEKRAMGR